MCRTPRRVASSRSGSCLGTRRRAIFVGAIALASGCGGAQAGADDARPPETAGSTARVPSIGQENTADVGSSTTTTATLANSPQETRLSGAEPAASGSAQPPLAALPHAHDPGRGPSDIRARIEAHRDEARACYDSASLHQSGTEGDLVMQWTIDPKGNVTQVSADPQRSQIGDPRVISCIGDVIKKITFAASAAGYETRASFPFHFHASHTVQPPSNQAH